LPKIPGYEILECLGVGGMGVVYKARPISLNRLVAIKFILAGAHAGSKERKRFHEEARPVAMFVHPNIVQIHEIGEAEGWPFITFQYVEGGSLTQRPTPQPPLQDGKLVEILARAIHAAHQRDIVQRDLKPGYVLLAADGTPLIADFSLAKRLDAEASQTVSGTVVGTPAYHCPGAGSRSKGVDRSRDRHPCVGDHSL
jgi:serine/threonine-protein kinase